MCHELCVPPAVIFCVPMSCNVCVPCGVLVVQHIVMLLISYLCSICCCLDDGGISQPYVNDNPIPESILGFAISLCPIWSRIRPRSQAVLGGRNGLATSASSNCYFRCQSVGRPNQISDRCHMTTVNRMRNALKRRSHAHSSQ